MTDITNWKSPTGQLLRQLATEEGEPLFVAKDVCEALGIVNVSDALTKLDNDEKMTIANPDSHSGKRGGAQFLSLVTEPGLYKLMARSNKPEAKAFDRWVRHEVLPTIRKTGAYQARPDSPPAWLMPMLATLQQSVVATVSAVVGARLDSIEARLQLGSAVSIPADEMARFKRVLTDVSRRAVALGLFNSHRRARYNYETRIRRAAGWPRSTGATLERMPTNAWHFAHVELSEIDNEVKKFGSSQMKLNLERPNDERP